MSLRRTIWYSWTIRGYWLHFYHSLTTNRYCLVVESDNDGKTYFEGDE